MCILLSSSSPHVFENPYSSFMTSMESHERSRNTSPLGSSHNGKRKYSSYAAASSMVARSSFLSRASLKGIKGLTPFIHMNCPIILLVIVTVSFMDDGRHIVHGDKAFKYQESGSVISEIRVFQALFSTYVMFDKIIGVRSTNGDNCAFQLHW